MYSIFQHSYDMHILNRSEKRYKSFFEESFAGMAVVDKTGKIIEVNQAFSKIFNIQVRILTVTSKCIITNFS